MQKRFRHNLYRLPAFILIFTILSALAGSSIFAQSPSNVVITNQASASYTDENGKNYQALSQIVTITVFTVPAHDVNPDHEAPTETAPQNAQIERLFTIVNNGNMTDTYTITDADVVAPAELVSLYYDHDGTGTVTSNDEPVVFGAQPDAAKSAGGNANKNSRGNNFSRSAATPGSSLSVTPPIAPGATFGVIAVVHTRNIDHQQNLTIDITARSMVNPAVEDDGTIINDVVPSIKLTAPDDANLPPLKLVENQMRINASVGQTLNYTIAFRNRSETAARQILVADNLPDQLEYIAGSLRLNNRLLTDINDADEGNVNNHRLEVRLASVAPDEVVRVTFQARINGSQQNATVVNFATLTGDNFQLIESLRAVAVLNSFGVIYNGRSGGNVTVANARVTLSTSAESAPLALPANGLPPNESNQNPFITLEGGRFNFTLGADQIGTPTSPASYVLRVEAPNYRPRLISVTVQPNAGSSGFYSVRLVALDGQPLAQAGSFALTTDAVLINNLVALAFNIPLFENTALTIEKSADRPAAEIGDVVTYRVSVQNRTQATADNIVIRDQLPSDFIYAQGSTQIQDGAGAWRSFEPETIAGNGLIFRVSSLNSGERITLSYRVRVGANARSGVHLNSATAAGVFLSGETFLTPPAVASVRVSDGAFSMRQVVIGRVFADANDNGIFDAADRPVSGARIYTDKGQFVVTDSAGMYNLPVIEDGALVLALDASTLPDGLSFTEDARRSDKNIDRLLRTPLLGGSLLRQNFALKVSDSDAQTEAKISKLGSKYDESKKSEKTRPTDEKKVTESSPKNEIPTTDSVKTVTTKTDKTGSKKSASKSKYLTELPTDAGTYDLESSENVEPIAPGAVEIISPKQDEVIMKSALELEARVAEGWTVALTVNDVVIGAENIGLRQQFHKNKVDSFTFIGINLRPGVNNITVKAISPDGREGESKNLSVMGRGAVKRLEITAERKELSANGRDTAPVIVRAFDEWGNPALDGQIAVSISQGNLLLKNAPDETIAPNLDLSNLNSLNKQIAPVNVIRQQVLSLENGVGVVKIIAGNAPGDAEITASVNDAEAKLNVRYVPDLRPSLLIGLAEASFGRAAPQMSLRGTDSNFYSRLGFFFRGQVFGKNLLTLAYDSERSLNRTTGRNRLFELDPLDRAYPVFGDSSTRFEEANSNAKLYARLDRGRSYAMFGDFETEMSQLALSGYSRKLTGVKLHLENSKGDFVSVTGARPGTTFARDVFPGNELGIAALSHADILQGSEVVTLETRDRRNPEIIISREQLIRSVDYNLDPLSGQIFFLRALLAFDFNLNLVQAIVTYEHYSDGNASNVYTGRAAKRFDRFGLKLGLSLVNQRQEDFGSYSIGGFDGEKTTFNGGRIRFEAAMSRGKFAADGNFFGGGESLDEDKNHNGNAFRVELEQPLKFKQSVLRADFAKSDADFFNPFGATITPGSQRGTISLEMKPRNTSQLRFGFTDERNETENVDNQRTTASLEWTEQLRENLRVRLGYDFRSFNDERGENDVNSNLFTVGVEWKPTSKLQLAVKREQNLGDADPTYPDQTTIAAKYQVNSLTNLFFTQRLAADAIRPISDITANGFAATASRNETAFGIETKLMRYSALSGRYQIENGINGTDSFAVIGLQNRLPLNKKSSLEIGFERGFHLAGQGKSFNSLLLGYSWQTEGFRSSVRYELRNRLGLGSILTAGAAGKIGDDITVLGRFQFASGDANRQQNKTFQGTAAFALRPLHTDRVALLFSYNARSFTQNNAKTFDRSTDRTDTLSTDGLWQASKKLEFYSHFALKFGSNSRLDLAKVSTMTYLMQGRAQYKLGKNWDVAAEARFLSQPSSATRRASTGAELGYWLTPDLRFGGGYNWTKAYQSAPQTPSEAGRRGFYFNVTTKLSRIFNLFGSEKGK